MINPYATLAALVAFAQTRLQGEEKGATAVEYGLLVGLIAVAIIFTVSLLGGQLESLFGTVSDELSDVAPPATT
ncbi:Flp family type IVb pilin [Blastococcus sp. SYSU DS0973]